LGKNGEKIYHLKETVKDIPVYCIDHPSTRYFGKHYTKIFREIMNNTEEKTWPLITP